VLTYAELDAHPELVLRMLLPGAAPERADEHPIDDSTKESAA